MRRFTSGRRGPGGLFSGRKPKLKNILNKKPARPAQFHGSGASPRFGGRRKKGGRKKLIFIGTACAAVVVLSVLFLGPVDFLGADFARAAFGNQTAPTPTPEASAAAEMTEAPTPTPTPEPTPEPTPDPTLTSGMRSEKVTQLQERLMGLGYLDIDEATDYYGPATAYAVSMFQRQHDLDQDGVAGPQTLEIIFTDAARPYTLLEGTSGNDVDMLQSRLMELGYLGRSTGYYGSETVDAVKAFQERNGIGVDGKTGQITLDLIYSSEAKPTEELERQTARQGTIDSFLASARAQLGKPYVWGAAGPSSFDCSGLVTYALRQAGSTTGRLNAQGFSRNEDWAKITRMEDMQPGDLIFYYNNKRSKVGHVGIYVGDGMMIDASSANGKVVHRSCFADYWRNHFVCARRPW